MYINKIPAHEISLVIPTQLDDLLLVYGCVCVSIFVCMHFDIRPFGYRIILLRIYKRISGTHLHMRGNAGLWRFHSYYPYMRIFGKAFNINSEIPTSTTKTSPPPFIYIYVYLY